MKHIYELFSIDPVDEFEMLSVVYLGINRGSSSAALAAAICFGVRQAS